MALSYLVDTSAWVKSRQRSAPPQLRARFDELLLGGQVVICDVVKLELLHHEENPREFAQRKIDLDALHSVPIDESVCSRALEVQAKLAAKGSAQHRTKGSAQHRSVKLPDYLIAAAAEQADMPVLHYDSDYEAVSSITGQPHEWISPRGSL